MPICSSAGFGDSRNVGVTLNCPSGASRPIVALIGCVFLPWGIAREGDGLTLHLLAFVLFCVKLAAGSVLLALFETAIAKMRVFRVPDFLGIALMLALLGTLLLFVSRSV